MLVSLTVRNTAIMDRLTVPFGEGLNCLTGETGAGKSIIIDSICCLLGERVSRESIRRGCETASVQGVFCVNSGKIGALLAELGIEAEEDGTLILFREYSVSGRNVCRVNGQTVTLTMLRKLGECLVDVHGQHDNHSLLSPATHIGLLDLFAGDEMAAVKHAYTEAYRERKQIDAELEELSGDPRRRASLIDLLQFQIGEIAEAELTPGEDERLEKRRAVLAHAEKITGNLERAYAGLLGEDAAFAAAGGILDRLRETCAEVEEIAGYRESYEEIHARLSEAVYILEDAAAQLRQEKEEALFDPQEAEKIDRRLDLIYRLERKYGDTVGDILRFSEEAEEKLEKLNAGESRCRELEERKKAVQGRLLSLAEQMHGLRVKAVELLETGIHKALADMEMDKVHFRVEMDGDSGEEEPGADGIRAGNAVFHRNGIDRVQFLVSTNPGEPFRPLSKIASGGELSRIMLAIKSVLADIDEIPVLIFDEIDTGISGGAAVKVAGKFRHIAAAHQVICVSHLAQIAAAADHNIFIRKEYCGDSVTTAAQMLDEDGKIREVSRLLDGDAESETARRHAEELIARMRSGTAD